ncbi:MAG: ABC transporter permease [Bacteroidota bacterium]|nr:ABC transporter permease [Bacteroidota bacterium]
MSKNLIVDVGISLLKARWKQTLVAAIGVSFSITMFITLLSFMTGLNHLLDSLILNRTPHIRIYNDIKANPNQPIQLSSKFEKNTYHFIHSIKSKDQSAKITNSLAIMSSLDLDKRVEGISPKIVTPAFFIDGGIEISAMIHGINPTKESQLFFFNDYIINGSSNDLDLISNSIILGKELAAKLTVDVGDFVHITTSRGTPFTLRVVGIYQSGLKEFDKVQSYASISTVQKILGEPNNFITEIQVRLNDVSMAPKMSKEYQELYAADAEDIQSANSQFETGSFIRTLISFTVGITLLVVAGFGIYNILNMMIYEKMDTIAILKATGFSGWDVNRIFIFIALSIGIFGGFAGLVLGLLLSLGIDQIPFETAALPTIKTYPINYDIKYYLIAAVFSLITTYLAGFFPARKASKVDPVVIIRGK